MLSSKETGITFNNRLNETSRLSIRDYDYFYNGAGVGIADFDGDGLQDIFLAGNLVRDRIYRNTGDLRFEDLKKEAL